MVAASFNGIFSCAAGTNGRDINSVNRIERVRFMSAPKE
jgi:hypothetical protein